MASKKNFRSAPKPATQPTSEQIDDYVNGGTGQDNNPQTHITTNVVSKPAPPVQEEKTKRLSVDIPQTTHMRFKTACSATGRKMTREIEEFINKRTAQLEKTAGIAR